MKKAIVFVFALIFFSLSGAQQAGAQKAAVAPAATSAEPDGQAPVEQAPVAQMPSDATAAAPAQVNSSSADVAQAPDAATKKISELVHAGKYADAQQLTTGLLLAYPNDQRLIKAQALIAKLMAGGANTSNNQPAASAADASAQLTGMDKVDYNALLELARQAQESMDLDQQKSLLHQFMEQSNTFLVKHPEQMLLWQLRAASAISLNEPMNGYRAGQQLIAMGAADSNDPNLQQLLAKLKLLGWLDSYKAQELQFEADNEQKKEAADAESVKNTFPVFHVNGLHYEYGHITINEDEAIYTGTDETDHIAKSSIRSLNVACNAYACGFYFNPRSGRRFFFLVVTEDAVANKSDKGKVYRPPSVLGDAIVARWKFVATDKKTLSPPKEGADPKPAAAAAEKSGLASVAAFTPAAPASAPAAEAPVPNDSAVVDRSAPAATAAGSDTAILHVYRPHHMTGMTEKFDVSVDGKKVAKLENSQMVRLAVTPGKHNITVEGRHMDDKVPVDDFAMAAGQEYWIKVDVDAGAFSAHTTLAVVPAEQAEVETKGFKDVSDNSTKK
jgi:hypothetical protein